MATTYADYSAYQAIRDEKHLSDYAVAKETGIATATISSWKQGVYEPKVDKLTAIAQFLDVPLEKLLSVKE